MAVKKWKIVCALLMALLFAVSIQAEAQSEENREYISKTQSSYIYRYAGGKLSVLEAPPENGGSASDNPYQTLKVPTQITKIGEQYFIVDCYHNQVLWSRTLHKPLSEWTVVTHDLLQPHTIAGDGVLYLIDDTENNRVMVYEKTDNKFIHTQTLEEIGKRPHYIVYDEETETFYVWSSLTGEMYLLKRRKGDNRVYVEEVRCIPELSGHYIRSFAMEGNQILFPAGDNGYIIRADKNSFEVEERYPVPADMAGMVQISRIRGYYYITISTDSEYNQNAATLVRVRELADLNKNLEEDIYAQFGKGGTPYYVSQMDGAYYLTHHRTTPGIWKFTVDAEEKVRIEPLYK